MKPSSVRTQLGASAASCPSEGREIHPADIGAGDGSPISPPVTANACPPPYPCPWAPRSVCVDGCDHGHNPRCHLVFLALPCWALSSADSGLASAPRAVGPPCSGHRRAGRCIHQSSISHQSNPRWILSQSSRCRASKETHGDPSIQQTGPAQSVNPPAPANKHQIKAPSPLEGVPIGLKSLRAPVRFLPYR